MLNTNDPECRKVKRSKAGSVKRRLLYAMTAVSIMLSGCAHSTWSTVKSTTDVAAWINPIAFALNMAGTIGEYATRPRPQDIEKKDLEKKNED